MTPDERWLDAMWTRIGRALPEPPAAVVDLGCGRLGGFVPALSARGYDAVGVDPEAPDGPDYRRVTFEEARLPHRPQAVIASTSLHHVHDPGRTLDAVAALLTPGGVMIVIEWDWEHFDEPTARWCFDRVDPSADHGWLSLDPSADHGWLSHHHELWLTSGRPWDTYVQEWAAQEGLNSPPALLRELDQRFERRLCETGPYYFPHLKDVTPSDEEAAIAAGTIRPGLIEYVGTVRS